MQVEYTVYLQKGDFEEMLKVKGAKVQGDITSAVPEFTRTIRLSTPDFAGSLRKCYI